MRHAIAAMLLAVTATFGSGCLFSHGQLDLLGSGTAFDEAQERFTRLVRWGHWEMATELVAEDARGQFIETMKAFGRVKFTDWEVLMMDVAEGFGTARVEVRLEGYSEATLARFEGVMIQEWTRSDDIKSIWRVRPDLTAVSAALAAK